MTLGLYVDFPGYTQYYTLGNQVPVYRFSSTSTKLWMQVVEPKQWWICSLAYDFDSMILFQMKKPVTCVCIYIYVYIWSWFLLLAWKKMWTFLCCLLGDVSTKRHLKWSETLLIELTIIQHPPSIIHRPSIINHHHTPWKINMEPSNHQLRKENDLANLHDYVPC